MCLAVPMKLVEIRDTNTGVADLDGVRHDVNLALIETPAIGDYLVVHAGFAIERLNQQEAELQLQFFAELAGATSGTGSAAKRPDAT